jgi:hypothetical protein
VVASASLAAGLVGGTVAAFTGDSANPSNSVTAADDFRAPTVGAAVISRSPAAPPGHIKQAGAYHVYADVTDTGNPPSGVAVVTADVSSVTTALTAVPLVAGSYTAGGVSYNYRSAPLVANGVLSEGSKPFSITAVDSDTNSGTRSGLSVNVDNTAPTGSDVQTANAAATAGRPETTDTITFTYSEPIDPDSVISGWNGAATNVVVRMTNGLLVANDTLRVFDPSDTTALPLGQTDLGRSDYVSGVVGGEILRFGATGTPSTMSISANSISITLGTASGSGTASTAAGNGTMSWPPSPLATDRAGNGASIAAASESGGADKEF